MSKNMKKEVGYGYVGLWSDGTLGWCLPEHLSPYIKYPQKITAEDWNVGEWSYKCKITIEPIKNEKGKITRRKIK